ncbi:MAG: cytochrome P450 [Nitrospirae bacterium]|nr:cytochrome P450 [Nitrospirota bacterium]
MSAMTVITADQLSSPDVIANPYPYYRELREHSPVNYMFLQAGAVAGASEPVRAWALMKYTDVYSALRNHDTFISHHSLAGKIAPRLALIQDDPPRHTRFRRLVNKAFTLKRIETLIPWITNVANELLDEMTPLEEDVMQAYAIPLPIKIIARLLGIPGEDYIKLKRWSDTFLAFSSMTPEERALSNQEMMAYFGRMASTRRAQGAEDLITALVEAEVEGESLDDSEIIGFCMLVLIAGNETTTNLIGNMLGILADRPELWRQLQKDRSLVDTVIEETLRYESPFQRLSRQTTREVELSGVKIPKDSLVTIYYGAANRDPDEFPAPDEFRLDRDLRNHVAFGAGIHYCLGAPLARVEAQITMHAFLDRFPVLARGTAPSVRQSTSLVVFGYQSLPLALGKA